VRNDFFDILRQICEIPSPTFHEKKKSDFVARLFYEAGLTTLQDDLFNVLAWSGESLPESIVVIEAHQDTVFDESTPLVWEEAGDTIKCPSVADNSVALAALIDLADRHASWPGVVFAATSREEGPGKGEGMRRVIEGILGTGRSIRYSISLEGIPLGRITYNGTGSIRALATVETAGGHPWLEPLSPSAVHLTGAIISKLIDHIGYRESPKTTLNIGTVSGGTIPTVRASKCSFTIDLRSVNREILHETFQLCRRTAERLCSEAGAEIFWEILGTRDPVSLIDEHELVKTTKEIHRQLGIQSQIRPAATNASIPLSMGLAAVTIGVCEGGKTHSKEEWISRKGIETGLAQIEKLLTRLCRIDSL